MAITEAYANSASISTTEYSLPANSTTLATNTTDGVYQLLLDLNAMAAGDSYTIKMYEKVQSSGTKRVCYTAVVEGAQSEIWVSPSIILMNGWDMTMQRTAGSDRTIEWSIRQVA